MIILNRNNGETLMSRNTLMNSSHYLLSFVAVQALCKVLQNKLSPCMDHYLIYYLRILLWILKIGFPASNVEINSSTLSCALKLCVNPLSSESLTIHELPITILEHSVVKMKNIAIGCKDAFLIITMILGHGTSITSKI